MLHAILTVSLCNANCYTSINRIIQSLDLYIVSSFLKAKSLKTPFLTSVNLANIYCSNIKETLSFINKINTLLEIVIDLKSYFLISKRLDMI